MDRFFHVILPKFFKSQARALAIQSFLLPRIGKSIHFRIIENAGKCEIKEITCDRGKKEKKYSNFRNQLHGSKTQGKIQDNFIYWRKKGKPDLISHPKSNHSVWTQQGQVIFP